MNTKGGFTKRLLVQQHHGSEAKCMLKSRFLERVNRYTLRFEHFVVAEDIAIFPYTDEPLVEIVTWDGDMSRFQPKDYQFRGTFMSVLEFQEALNRFFNDFSKALFNIEYINLSIENDDAVNADVPFNTSGSGESYCSFVIDPSGRATLCMKPQFYDNAMIKLHPLLQQSWGLRNTDNELVEYLYYFETDEDDDGDVDIFSHERFDVTYVTGASEIAEERIEHDENDLKIFELGHITDIDRRLSLDVVADLPIARRLNIVERKETHDALIARFFFRDIDEMGSRSVMDNERKGLWGVSETSIIGQDELTRNNIDTEALHLLPGDIQQVRLSLFVRYKNADGTVTEERLPIEQGFWSSLLHFSKKH